MTKNNSICLLKSKIYCIRWMSQPTITVIYFYYHLSLHFHKYRVLKCVYKTRQGCSLLPLSCNIVWSHSHHNQRRKARIHIGKSKTVCKWYDTTQKTLKVLPENHLELINEFSKVSGHKINMQNWLALYPYAVYQKWKWHLPSQQKE